jgi:predicted NAD/FAD-binding protein
VGSGVAGLTSAHLLRDEHDVELFEADHRLGGHTNTVVVDLAEGPVPVDTGFIVHNSRNYPLLCRLLAELGIDTRRSEMSFSVSDAASGFEYRATNLDTLLARRTNVLRPELWRLLVDILRFHRAGQRFLAAPDPTLTVRDWLGQRRWSPALRELFLVPLVAAIWSADPVQAEDQPAEFLLSFLANHGLLGLRDLPEWRTIPGGAQRYVDAIAAGLKGRVHTSSPVRSIHRDRDTREVVLDVAGHGTRRFDRVVLAVHSDQALALLSDASTVEKDVLGAIDYQPNRATLHSDARLMPASRRAWAAWNYHRPAGGSTLATLTYDCNLLQGLTTSTPLFVTLNRDDEIDERLVHARFGYAHPVFSLTARAAQRRHHEIDGVDGIHYCGAYWGNGFHEDGVRSAVTVCEKLGARWA